jgi:small subunit ribosomal protein S20
MARKSKAKSAVKELQSAISSGNMEQAKENLNKTVSTLHKTASKGVIHKKKASRKISRLTRAVNRIATPKAL